MTEIPYRYDVTATTAALHAKHGELEDGAETGEVVSVAGRLMLKSCLLYTSPSPRDQRGSRMPSSA